MNTTAGKLSIGLLTLLPILLAIVLLVAFAGGIAASPKDVLQSEEPVFLLIPLGWMLLGTVMVIATSLIVVVYYLVHVINNKRLDAGQRLAWAILVLFGGTISCLVYWIFQIWREEDDRVEHNYTS